MRSLTLLDALAATLHMMYERALSCPTDLLTPLALTPAETSNMAIPESNLAYSTSPTKQLLQRNISTAPRQFLLKQCFVR